MPISRIALLTAALLAHVPVSALAACPPCDAKQTEIKVQRSALQSYEALLLRNRAFLDGPEGKEPSKSIKVKSNILIILLKVDTTKNLIAALEKDVKTACTGCAALPATAPVKHASPPSKPATPPPSATTKNTGIELWNHRKKTNGN